MSLRYASRVFLRAAQMLREQQMASKSMANFKSSSTSSSSQSHAMSNQMRWFSSGLAEHSAKASAMEEELIKRRKAEKAEKVMNLICWGPN